MRKRTHAVACLAAALWSSFSLADYTGLAVEAVDPAAMGWIADGYPIDELDTYRVYATFDETGGLVSAVGDGLDEFVFSMTSRDGTFYSISGAIAAPLGLWDLVPELQWESWLSMGEPHFPLYFAPGFLDQVDDLTMNFTLNDTGWLSSVTAPPLGNGVIAVDGRVLLAQFTVSEGVGIEGTNWRVSGREGEDLTESFVALSGFSVSTGCLAADLDGDGSVAFPDLTALLAAWGPCPGCVADLDGDGEVGFPDLTALLAEWGDCV